MKEKQKEISRKLDFSNITKADTKITTKSNAKSKKKKLVPIKFKVHNDLIEQFQILRIDYAKYNKKFSLSNNQMFLLMVGFLDDHFSKKGILLECPSDFKKSIIKPGKRKATERTYPSKETSEILFTITEDIADNYMDIMFSFIMNNPKDDILNSHHSRTYFFYDFIAFLEKNKKGLLKFTSISE